VVEDTLRANGLSVLRAWEADVPVGSSSASASARALATTYTVPVGAALIAKLPKLEIVSVFGVGYDSVDVREAAARGIVVTNTPGVLTEEVADLALGLLLCTVRELPQADRFVRSGQWQKGAYPLSDSLRGRTVGIYGLGRIGKAVARRCEAFGLTVAYHGRTRQPEPFAFHDSLVGLARAVDVLVVAAPASADTKHAVDAEVLAALGPRGILVNVARGSLVDEGALVAALASGALGAAGLDVFENEPNVPPELLAMHNVVVLPHVGSASRVTRDAMGKLVADNLVSWFAGRGPLTPVSETPFAGGR
jgi:lactate dehydrogenase-like 2-hydroxyacid dehydrogenase